MLSVFIAESNDPSDVYEGRLDGYAANEVLKVRRLRTEYRMVFDAEHFCRAIADAADGNFDVFHLSCHGNGDGIGLTDGASLNWMDLARCFKPFASRERMIVISSCMGGHVGFSKALQKTGSNVRAVFGALDDIGFSDACIAWSILYNEFASKPLCVKTFQTAIDKLNSVIDGRFVYRRFDPIRKLYGRYPSA